jgi:hypothetical protein
LFGILFSRARTFCPAAKRELAAAIQELDGEVELLGRLVVAPPWLIKLQLFPVRIFESSNVRRVLDVLARSKPAAAAARSAG